MIYKIAVPSDSVRSFKDPHHPKIRIVHALVNVMNLPLDIPLDPDPRIPKAEGKVTPRIEHSLRSNDGRFHLLNRGICISAKAFELDAGHNILRLDIPEDEESYGILDGGHTFDAIRRIVSSIKQAYPTEKGQSAFMLTDQYVHLEILVGVKDDLADIAEARNFSVPLKPWSLASYRDKFEWFLDSLGEDFRQYIRTSENNEEPIGILDLIQVMTAVNPKITSPQDSYNSSGKCLDYFIDSADRYGFRQMAPVARSIIRLYDYVRYGWAKAYNTVDESGAHGRYGKTKEAKERKRKRVAMSSYYFLGDSVIKGEHPIEKGFALPLMCGFRALLEEHDGELRWYADPFRFFDRHGPKLVRLIMAANDSVGNNPNLVGRDAQNYTMMYSEVRRWYLEDKFSEREASLEKS